MPTSDIIIIGAGPGGYETALHAAKAGQTVTLIEEKELGGTCLNEGCIPTKCLAHTAELLQSARTCVEFGVTCENTSFSLQQTMTRKEAVVAQLVSGIETLMKTPGITLVRGRAAFKSASVVTVGEEEYTAKHIIIATGSSTKMLPVPGVEEKGVVTSREMLSLTNVPQRLAVVGGGVIGLELAAIWKSFGVSEVTVIEYCKEILPNLDKDMAKRLRMALKKQGIVFQTGCAVQRIDRNADETLTVSFENKGKTETVDAELVLMAVGRTAHYDGLNIEAAGIAATPRGITVDENMQTNVPGIYAIGDVNGLCQLAHAATFQGKRALNHILGRQDNIDLSLVPAVVFTSPQLATVGKREEDFDAVEKPVIHKAFYRANGRALTMGAEEGYVKVIADQNGTILGVHVLGDCAAELIHEATVLIKQRATVTDLADIIHAHPTLSELYLSAIG